MRRFRTLSVAFSEVQEIVTASDKQRFSLKEESFDDLEASSSIPGPHDEPSRYRIRANQGHSLAIASEDLLKPILITDADCPQQAVHGTDPPGWSGIIKSGGLKKMGRQHIHFVTGVPEHHKKGRTEDPVPSSGASNPATQTKGVDRDSAEIVGDDGTKESASSAKSGAETVISGMRKSATIMIWVDVVRSMKDGGLSWWRSDNGVILTEGNEDGWIKMEWVDRVERRGTGEVLWRRPAKTS